MGIIDIENLTKLYTKDKGISNITLNVEKGEAFGITGASGSGKSTIIKLLMGIIKPNKGSCMIDGYDCFYDTERFMNSVSYLPEKFSFPNDMTGEEFINITAELKMQKDKVKIKKLMDIFQVNKKSMIKSMSEKEKKGLALVSCFMNDSQIYILDEPFSLLKSEMKDTLMDMILFERRSGKTIFMSAGQFEYIERICNRIALIKEGKLEELDTVSNLKKIKSDQYIIDFATKEDMALFSNEIYDFELAGDRSLHVKGIRNINEFTKCLSNYNIIALETVQQSPEELFNNYYK